MIRQVGCVVVTALLLAACEPPATRAKPLPGGDRDAHGCIPSAGYSWCERAASCVRPWELARQQALAAGKGAFDAYCSSAR